MGNRETPDSAVHFGLKVRRGSKHGLRIDRETYAVIDKKNSVWFPRERDPWLWDRIDSNFEDTDHRIHTDEWCDAQLAEALRNFDLHMAYFKSLDWADFDLAVRAHVASIKGLVEVHDLNLWKGKRGLYVMVLDDYRQIYVGQTESEGGVAGRIRQHWSGSKAFDRLLFGSAETSIMSIDSFRALDTTRIYALRARHLDPIEARLIESFPREYLTNRVMGGSGRLLGVLSAVGIDVLKQRRLEELPK